MEKEKWYYIDSGARSAAYNMALDECLLNWQSERKMPPIVRFYQWATPTLSIGYFQRVEKEINMDEVEKRGFEFVRRPTGGRSVLHDKELTYSVIVSEDHPDMPKTVTEAYRVISQGILEGFQSLGLDAYFAVPKTQQERDDLKNPRSSVCFDAPSWYEIVVEGRKIAGSAQTRQKGVILQHGSIPLEIDLDTLYDLFLFPNERIKERMKSMFSSKAVAVNALTDKTFTIKQLKEAFRDGFEKGLHVELQTYELTNEQKAEVEQLMKEKYETKEWNYKK
ncbi:biotin/lipoate A/B protein ligase family protein [Ectobacillus antri]|jgi:lipoate-protein ligase A|uniref:Octanoyltransferase LipM n=1 Tax=Ectobacillus antri TaxID=2486280 RepID=A0ABT6H3X8_9BACI|nr:biotin/lipoate A/B protein ligase family protein [Ectobacillus antri]MDG4655577.1 biotin/lipoate A/B protein ligase family protein [Ectobacillus antri]MDG5753335.1 biotin/lipoate A/B protein ligase family protein [Ectobacillus antri]